MKVYLNQSYSSQSQVSAADGPSHREGPGMGLKTKKIYITFLICSLFFNTIASAQTNGDEDKEMFNAGKQRDQQAIDNAINGWWTASMKNREQRIQWWRQAKFGMFIHWGVYSLPGGAWKGNKVGGYAEHLMRKEKISRSEYLGLAHQFNPLKFNADEWILNAKKAGMNYFIITSKHHDGFAMFDSKVSDFDITDQTPFKRDPMAELAAAAKKYGMKFGFYYSHAFDWEHPDAPDNDWEYKNPGGDSNLYGGRQWYDLHPELLTKAKKYVDEKAIPQIIELITKYHPDILWFDTPQKLPLSENIRILKAIRETAPGIVVNGRLVRGANVNFGDYKNTADRPAEFFPVTGDWEAIPTTNESYGYHQFDNSHKPVSHFIQLLTTAASRGGNLLMNIGPKGDGSFDLKDMNILNGIGTWLKKNGESIYGTSASPLPYHSWGVSTVKKNKLYLHVFHWPGDGKLYVSGFAQISNGCLLADASKKLAIKSTPSGDKIVIVPKQAPDSINSVLVFDWQGQTSPDSIHFITPNTKEERFLAYDARQKGTGFIYGDGKKDRYYVEGWKSKDQSLSWKLRSINVNAVAYKVLIKYIAPKQTSGGTYSLTVERNHQPSTIGEYYFQQHVFNNDQNTTVITRHLATIALANSTYTITISPIKINKDELMKLLEVQLVPVTQDVKLPKIFADAEQQTKLMLQEIPKASAATHVTPGATGNDIFSPRTLDTAGNLTLVTSRDWTSGFFPGVLWFLYEYTGKKEWLTEAQKFTAQMEKEKTNGTTHDMGFKIYCSFGTGLRLTKNESYKNVIIESAKTLSKRFNANAGVLRSWDHSKQKWDFPVIIDNMMNLELLFAATRFTCDSSFYKIAVSHANATMKNHYRPDYSSYHVVDYDSTFAGKINKKTTHQGFSNESAWSRGQAWGLYGFTMCYRETKNKTYLNHADKIAAFILHHPNLPKDRIPYWDFDAPSIPNEPRDASAAAIIASALYELSLYSLNGKEYKKAADKIIESLTRYYRAPVGGAKGFILLHSTGSKPSDSEVDVPLNYADYYYLEALLRMKKLNEGRKGAF